MYNLILLSFYFLSNNTRIKFHRHVCVSVRPCLCVSVFLCLCVCVICVSVSVYEYSYSNVFVELHLTGSTGQVAPYKK